LTTFIAQKSTNKKQKQKKVQHNKKQTCYFIALLPH